MPAASMGGVGGKALPPAPPTFLSSSHAGHPVRVTRSVRLNASPRRVFEFHADVRNLPRLTPGPARIVRASIPSRVGDVQVIEIGVRPFAARWRARIVRFDPPRVVVDVQAQGPFRYWRHTHTVRPEGAGARLVDRVEFRLLPGRLGRLVDTLVVAPALKLLFVERHRRTRRYLDGR
jgi:ligand-binding SRPBCC domain-containing protein